LYNSYEVNLPC